MSSATPERPPAIANSAAESSLEHPLQESDDPQLIAPAMELVSVMRRFSSRYRACPAR